MTDVRTQSAEAAALNADVALIAALLGGTKTMRAAGETYLPKWPNEDDESYKLRLAVSTLFPAYARTVEVLAAKPFSKPLTVGEDVPARLKPWTEDIDRSGRNLHSFASELCQAALGYGFGGILVDYPKTEGIVTRAQELEAGVRPYFVQIHVKNILGWLPKNATSVAGLTQLRLLESAEVPNGEFDTKRIEQVRVLGQGTWQTWRKSEAGKKEWVLFEEGVTTLPTIPFVPVYGKRLAHMEACPPLVELGHMNVEHWQSKSDQQNILHIARVPILFMKGVEAETTITVGAGTAVKTDRPDADMKFVEHSGAAIEAGRLSILDLEDRMRQAGAELLVIKPGNVTESQTLADNEQGSCALKKVAENIEDALDQALQLMAAWVGEPQGGHVTVFKDFGAATLAEASADLLFKSATGGKISAETYFNELQRRGTLSPDLDWDEEKKRIENDRASDEPPTFDVPMPTAPPKPGAKPEPVPSA
ncbi:DUF4055 domain-containing protein [Massilia antarctica]|uniref:DUF4055 domain-containing protein n=1 Tax=Massilia antarctica TaxID=2765360 RepID=UPI002271BD1D|nr:DUF4055 domain-containing protein [Massilia sp. H27-R4]MCY0910848.1 DUF4055 domain-containing protein [Massilia sp. H27-R4]